MRFLPTVTLDSATFTALRNGQLRLQTGQWVKIVPFGPQTKPSRFVAARKGHLDIVHPDGPHATGKVQTERFQRRAKIK